MILFFDTETTGLAQDRLPVDHPDQPHIVQLAAQLCTPDGKPRASFSFVVDPGIASGVLIPERASAVHGITADIAAKFGVSPQVAVEQFKHLYDRADEIVAHNLKFDIQIIETAIARVYKKVMRLAKPRFCTMESATPVVNLPPTEKMRAAGFNKPKPPKLEECIKHFFGEDLTGAHDAMVDLTACRRVYFHLKTLEAAQ